MRILDDYIARRRRAKEIPPNLRSPRSWPLYLVIALTLGSVVLTWDSRGETGEVRRAAKQTDARVDVSYEVRCAGQRIRLTTPPTTPVEVRFRSLAERTFDRDCPKG